MSTTRVPAFKASSNSTIPKVWITDPTTGSWLVTEVFKFANTPSAQFRIMYHHGRFQLKTKSDGSIRIGSISPGLVRTDIVKATFPENPGFSDQIYSTFPCLEAGDMADLIDYLLSTPQHIQMQDLQVTHVHSGLLNNYSEDSSSKSNEQQKETDNEQTKK